MSTLALVVIVITIAAIGVASLSFVRWREAKRLAFARQVVEYTDGITLLNNIGSELQPWLSASMLRFIGNAVIAYQAKLKAIQAPDSKKVDAALSNAMYWSQIKQKSIQALPGHPQQAQKFREGVRNLLTALKDSYKLRIISAEEVKSLLNEAKNLNISITLTVLLEKVKAAEKMHNSKQALHYLKKSELFLSQQPDLSAEHTFMQQEVDEKIKQHSIKIEQDKQQTTARLAEDAAKLSAEDEAWKKKRF